MKTALMAGVAGTLALWLAGVGSAVAAQSGRPPKNITADEAIACIKTAVAAKAGRVKDLEVNIDNGRTFCEVEVIAGDGKKYEVHVDVAANKVTRVED